MLATTNYMAQDQPDLAVAARVLSQSMAVPSEGTEMIEKGHPALGTAPQRSVDVPSWLDRGPIVHMRRQRLAWGVLAPRKSCIGCHTQRDCGTICRWSKAQANAALSSWKTS